MKKRLNDLVLVGLFLILESQWAVAQDSTSTGADPSCGPADVNFSVALQRSPLSPMADPAKATLYVIEEWTPPRNTFGHPTMKIGADGEWLGATQGNSVAAFTLPTGNHHFCIEWQTRFKHYRQQLTQFYDLETSPGMIYYLRVHPDIDYSFANEQRPSLSVSVPNKDEALHLLSEFPEAKSSAKKH